MRWVAVQVTLFVALAVAFGSRMGPEVFPPVAAFRQVGWLLAGVALLVLVVAAATLGDSFRVPPEPAKSARFVARGIYRHLRHPMYTAVLVLCIAAFLLRPTLPVALAALANAGLYLRKARHEEGLLVAMYPEYAAYRRVTRGVLGARGTGRG